MLVEIAQYIVINLSVAFILGLVLGYVIGKNYGEDFIKIVNPEIISQNDKQLLSEEGCLSFPELAVRVSRPENIVLKYQDPYGNFIQREFADWQARIILHEIDHLNAITLYSRASTLIRNRYEKKIKKNTYDM